MRTRREAAQATPRVPEEWSTHQLAELVSHVNQGQGQEGGQFIHLQTLQQPGLCWAQHPGLPVSGFGKSPSEEGPGRTCPLEWLLMTMTTMTVLLHSPSPEEARTWQLTVPQTGRAREGQLFRKAGEHPSVLCTGDVAAMRGTLSSFQISQINPITGMPYYKGFSLSTDLFM